MMPEGRAKEIISGATELSGDARAAYLDMAFGRDAALRARVDRLLRAAEDRFQFMSAPTSGGDVQTQSGQMSEGPGSRIGPYRLLQAIGEGGFGTVFMAEQETPVSRRVAIKVIKLGMDTHQVIARFEAERQALAMMDHPNIARVLDAGATETGRPYFVMELVRGEAIFDHC
ncbi:MAG: protein kinase [Planctomycetes bacterium]|nr:protein kinase [Planctomycetota bacterium]